MSAKPNELVLGELDTELVLHAEHEVHVPQRVPARHLRGFRRVGQDQRIVVENLAGDPLESSSIWFKLSPPRSADCHRRGKSRQDALERLVHALVHMSLEPLRPKHLITRGDPLQPQVRPAAELVE